MFSDEEQLKRLNAITHRHISDEVQHRLREHAMNGGTLAAIDAIELFSSGMGERCDFTIGVLADEEVRAARIMARDGISREYALLRIRAQRPDSYFRQMCSVTVENNRDEANLLTHINNILKERMHHG